MYLSFIIPVYNSASFLNICLDSIIDQGISMQMFEIVIVNDGSTDNSEEVINEWKLQNQDVLINYFYQENKGQGAARNLAISKSVGEYLWFVDSDDFIEKYSAKLLFAEMKKDNLDTIWFDHRLVNTSGKIFKQPSHDVKTNFSQSTYNGEQFLEKIFNTSCMPVMFIFKRKLITDHNLLFHEGIYFEDIIFTLKLIFYSKRIKYYNLLVYNYVIHDNSTMRSKDKLLKRTLDSITVVKELLDFSKKENSKPLSNYIDKFTAEILMYNYRLAISQNNILFLEKFSDEMRKNNLYPFKIYRPLRIAFIANIANYFPSLFRKLTKLRPVR